MELTDSFRLLLTEALNFNVFKPFFTRYLQIKPSRDPVITSAPSLVQTWIRNILLVVLILCMFIFKNSFQKLQEI